jgi:hypothetical protein
MQDFYLFCRKNLSTPEGSQPKMGKVFRSNPPNGANQGLLQLNGPLQQG